MKAFRLLSWHGPAELVEAPVPEPASGEVRLRIGGAGVCHTDLHLMHGWDPQTNPAVRGWRLPFTLGHENAGWIDALGPNVEGWAIDMPVAVSLLWGCGRCKPCRTGADNYCEDRTRRSGGFGRDGGLAEYMLAPARNLVALKDLAPWQAAPLTDAGLSAYHAVKGALAVLEPDAAAVVIGTGGLGHLAVGYLEASTGALVVAVDRKPGALALARRMGADLCLPSDDAAPEAIRDATDGHGAEAVFDFVGTDATLQLAARVVSRRGRIVIVGLGGGTLPLSHATLPFGATVGYSLGGSTAELAEVVALAERGRVLPVIERYALDDIAPVYNRLAHGEVTGRAVIVPEPSALNEDAQP